LSQDEIKAFAEQLASQLGETEAQPRKMLADLVQYCGIEFSQEIYRLALETEAQGGLMTHNEDRRRTLGGVFFYLARGKMPPETRKLVFPRKKGKKQTGSKGKSRNKQAGEPSLLWEERLTLIEPLLAEQGELTTVKIVLIGRPGRIETRKDLVVTVVSHTQKNPALPKGVPAPPKTPTNYTVYIGAKQWRRVEDAIKNPEDALIIEGTCSYDEAIKGIAVFATNVTTKMLEAQKRESQKAKTAGDAPTTAATPSIPPVEVAQEAAAPAAEDNMSHLPPEVADKLRELRASADLFRQKIASIQAKPAGQQFGLDMTQKLLSNVESEIATLEKQYPK
jgi:hypothetical protein